jgi:Ankyrin repeats (3 copies)
MNDSIDDDDDIDRAYRRAVETSTDVAVLRRRRRAVLEAVEAVNAVHATPADRPHAAPGHRAAANEAFRHQPAAWWRGVAAACVIGASALVVVHMQQAPEATVEAGLRSAADRVAAPAVPGESTPARVAEAALRQSALATAPAPAPAIVTDVPRRAPIVPATPPAGVPSSTAPKPVAKAARSAFPGDGMDSAVSTGRVAPSDAAAAAMDAAPREAAPAALPSTPVLKPDPPERRERSASRPEQPSAASKEASGAVAALPPSHGAAQAGNAGAKSLPPRDDAARVGEAAARAPSEGLLAAAHQGDIDAARALLQTTDPDAERDADGRTALAIAVRRADLPLVKLLLASGANRHAADRFGHTPLGYAKASGDTTMLQAFGTP